MPAKHARLYDVLALLTVIVVVALDQWTKALIVKNLTIGDVVPFPLVGHFLALEYIRNNGAAFSMFASNGLFLAVLIVCAIAVVIYLYVRLLNSGPVAFKIIFGMILGGALGNLIDRVLHSGYVVDFISFRIPQISFYFAIFNVADACISVGVVLLLLLVLVGGLRTDTAQASDKGDTLQSASPPSKSGTLNSTKQDA